MIYVYNPSNCPTTIAGIEVQAHNYDVVNDEKAAFIRQSGCGLLIEGDPNFPAPFKTYGN